MTIDHAAPREIDPEAQRLAEERRAERARAWQAFADGLTAQTILPELAAYCGSGQTTARMDQQGRSDPIASAIAEGRRQVWLFICARLKGTNLEETLP